MRDDDDDELRWRIEQEGGNRLRAPPPAHFIISRFCNKGVVSMGRISSAPESGYFRLTACIHLAQVGKNELDERHSEHVCRAHVVLYSCIQNCHKSLEGLE